MSKGRYGKKPVCKSHAGMPELLRPHYPLKKEEEVIIVTPKPVITQGNNCVTEIILNNNQSNITNEASTLEDDLRDKEAGIIILHAPVRKVGYVSEISDRDRWDLYQKRMAENNNKRSLEANTTSPSFIKSELKDNSSLSDTCKEDMKSTTNESKSEIVNAKCEIKDESLENYKLVSSDVNKMEDLPVKPSAESIMNIEYRESEITIIDIIDVIKKLTKSKKGDSTMVVMRMLLTYKGVSLNKLTLFNHISDILGKKAIIEDFLIVHEKYEEEYHTHIYFKLNQALRIGKRIIFDFNNIRPNIEKLLQHKSDLEKLFYYLLDKDDDSYTNFSTDRIHEIMNNTNTSDEILTSSDLKQQRVKENKIITKKVELTPQISHNLKENNIKLMEEWEFKPWQRFLLNVVEGDVDKNIFYWYWEPLGLMGKTQLTNYIDSNYENVLVINTLDTYSNMLNSYLDVIKTCTIKTVIIDLSRQMSNILLRSTNSGIFEFIEKLKEGFVNNIFNKTRIKLIPCHVIVFSNCITNVEEISPSKWRIIKILEDGEACMGSVNRKSEIEYESVHI